MVKVLEFFQLLRPYIVSNSIILVRDIAPKEMKTRILMLYGICYSIGIELEGLAYVFVCTVFSNHLRNSVNSSEITDTENLLIKWMVFSPPIILSLIQMIFGEFVYKYDTPRQLCENKEEENALIALSNIYRDSKRRVEEFEKAKKIATQMKHRYPTYKQLLSVNYRELIFQGIAMMLLRNFCEVYLLLEFTTSEFTGSFGIITLCIFPLIEAARAFIPFYYVDGI